MEPSILHPGRNCWRTAHADRLRVLVDVADYFSAFRRTVGRARARVSILGWDIDSRVAMLRDDADGWPVPLHRFLKEALRRRPGLEIHILVWDFSLVYALERQGVTFHRWDWVDGRRLLFRTDDHHPPGGAHHQKVVVVDDAVAFLGGMDLSRNRWDTPSHVPDDPRRTNVKGDRYVPYHDVQCMVSGEVAKALGELARERWYRRTGQRLAPPPARDPAELWPEGLAHDLADVGVGLARTDPPHEGRPEVREVERLYLDAVAAARRSIYIENQYLTARSVAEALGRRLREPDGPDVVLVTPRDGRGLMEKSTMDVLRARILAQLRAADLHGRLAVYHPVQGGDEAGMVVHSKVLVVDDRLLRVGSANLSNRSMGLDTECDLAVEGTEPRIRRAICRTRNRLLAEHLGCSPSDVTEAEAARGSLRAAVEALRGGPRTLVALDFAVPEVLDRQVPEEPLFDPDRSPEDVALEQVLPPGTRPFAFRRGLGAALALVGLMVAVLALRFTPLGDALVPEGLLRAVEALAARPGMAWAGTLAFAVAALVGIPWLLLVLVVGFAFGFWTGLALSLAGTLLAAAAGFGLGRWLGRDRVGRLTGRRLRHVIPRVAGRGVLNVVAVRVVPSAPFTAVNLLVGTTDVRFLDFLLGTLLGVLPGLAGLVFVAGRLSAVLVAPTVGHAVAFLLSGSGLVVLLLLFARQVQRMARRAGQGGHRRGA